MIRTFFKILIEEECETSITIESMGEVLLHHVHRNELGVSSENSVEASIQRVAELHRTGWGESQSGIIQPRAFVIHDVPLLLG